MKPEMELLDERNRLVALQEDLATRTNGRALASDESEQWDKIQADIDITQGQLERNRQVKRSKELIADAAAEARGNRAPADAQVGNEGGSEAYTRAFDKWMRRGHGSMTPEERAVLITRGTDAQTTVTDNLGGYAVPESFGDKLIMAMAAFGGMLEVSDVVRTSNGASMPFPVINETAIKGRLLAENAAMAVKDVAFGTANLGAYVYTSDIVKLSYQLIQDNAVNLEQVLLPLLSNRLGRIVNEHLTTGDGSGKPTGFLTTAGSGKTATAVAAFTRGELIDVQHSVDSAYRGTARWMFNDTTLAAIRKLSIGSADDRPLWQAGMQVGAPDLLEGKPYTINNDMPDAAAGTTPIAFGAFENYRVRMVKDVTMMEMNELYSANLQKGFAAYTRVDGALLDTTSIKKLTMAAS
jgi:HK97 family phage major capsid protein